MNYLQDLKHDTTRGIIITTRGEQLQIKEHRGWRYVNYNGLKIGISKINVIQPANNDPVYDYVFKGGSVTHPCPAMDYWILRWRMKRKISIIQYKKQFLNHAQH